SSGVEMSRARPLFCPNRAPPFPMPAFLRPTAAESVRSEARAFHVPLDDPRPLEGRGEAVECDEHVAHLEGSRTIATRIRAADEALVTVLDIRRRRVSAARTGWILRRAFAPRLHDEAGIAVIDGDRHGLVAGATRIVGRRGQVPRIATGQIVLAEREAVHR